MPVVNRLLFLYNENSTVSDEVIITVRKLKKRIE